MHSLERFWTGRRWAAALVVMLALVLTACGRDETPSPTPLPTTEQAPAAETPPASTTPEATPEPAATPTEAPTGEAAPSAFESPLQAESPLAAPESPLPTPVSITDPEMGAFVGRIVSTNLPGNPPLAGSGVRLGNVIWNEDHTDGTFVIEGSKSPGADIAADGTFAFLDLPPGEYVMVVGDLLGKHEVIVDADGKAKIFVAEAGEVTDLGTIGVKLE
ncbi:MAG TPA: hypothetical protein VNK95_02160 [Caldilineaceae bacterium]|nr:hypothetical protein [Caldilineaceae bacterium]